MGQNNIVMVGKNSGPVLSRLSTKVYEILGHTFQRPFPIIYTTDRLKIRDMKQRHSKKQGRKLRERKQRYQNAAVETLRNGNCGIEM